ncbi:hypothetical protein SAY87_031791 [Trapa incisa]|uniref:TFIIS N-terminal domain-containing protein n=1 Tax=Trapa incisa TaxID=236973 RepID=A0AAN7QLG3_9MYRT|nr:hypothetical protein SAY87_031791 [Trapa incisa]
MERELVELFQAAKKAADAAFDDGATSKSPEVSRCVDALKQLKSFPVSFEALLSTQVGKKLRQLKKHPCKIINSMALDVLEVWKNIIIAETAKNKNNGCSGGKLETKMEKADSIEVATSETVVFEKIHKNDKLKASTPSSGPVKVCNAFCIS